MDRLDFTAKIKELFDKYKFVLAILGIGILLMVFPGKDNAEPQPESNAQTAPSISRAEELENILGQMSGVGRIQVLLTESDGSQTVYQTDEERTQSKDTENIRVKTVTVTNSDREEVGLVRAVTPPVYLGAIIVCQGGDNPSVKLAVVQAVSNVTGIPSDRITVLKMK